MVEKKFITIKTFFKLYIEQVYPSFVQKRHGWAKK